MLTLALLIGACGDDDGAPSMDGGGHDAPAPDALADVGTPDARAGDVGAHDAGVDAPADAGPDAAEDAGPPSLLVREGCFHEVSAPDDTMRIDFGEVGVAIPRLAVTVTIELGPWREDVFDRDVLNHNLFGLSRNGPVSRVRYIGGLGAQVHPPRAPGLQRTTLFFGRVDLEERPPGMGFMGYTTFRERANWNPGTRYRVEALWDADAGRQILDVTLEDGTPFSHVEGDIAYYEPGLTDDGWWLEFGAPETDHRDVSPVGARYCDLRVESR